MHKRRAVKIAPLKWKGVPSPDSGVRSGLRTLRLLIYLFIVMFVLFWNMEFVFISIIYWFLLFFTFASCKNHVIFVICSFHFFLVKAVQWLVIWIFRSKRPFLHVHSGGRGYNADLQICGSADVTTCKMRMLMRMKIRILLTRVLIEAHIWLRFSAEIAGFAMVVERIASKLFLH